MTVGTRIGIGIVGALLLFVGWAIRSFEEDYSSLGFQVLQAPDGTFGAYQPDDTLGPFELEEDGDLFAVVNRDGAIVFRATEEEAAFWMETKGADPAFTGTRSEVEAWVDEQEAAEDDFTWSLILMIGGGLTLLGAVALGRD
jgi:hypothetical protein